jgi:hypothetical protein
MVARKWGEYWPAQALVAGTTVSCLTRSSERCGEEPARQAYMLAPTL